MTMKLKGCDLRLLTGVAIAAATTFGALAACSTSGDEDVAPAAEKTPDASAAAGDEAGATVGTDGGAAEAGVSEAGAPPDEDAGDAGDAPDGQAPGCGFASAPTAYALPAVVTANGSKGLIGFSTAVAECSNSRQSSFTVFDLDGDGQRDLVETEDCIQQKLGPIGVTQWAFWKGTPTGFAADASTFSLPSIVTANGSKGLFSAGGFGTTCTGSGLVSEFTLFDLDHDGHVDLVETMDCADGLTGPIGVTHWDYYRGSATGFAATATSWALPAAAVTSCNVGEFNLGGTAENTAVDMDGDGLLDLVETYPCNVDGPVGVTKWLLWKGSATGFATTATDFTLPPIVTANGSAGLFQFAGGGQQCSNQANNQYTVRDFDGDRVLDLVELSDCAQGTAGPVGVTQWTLFKGTPTGFDATPRAYALPPAVTSGGSAGLFNLAFSNMCTNGQSSKFTFTDLDADGQLDLVETEDCVTLDAGPTGASFWALYKGSPTGFAATATQFALPPAVTEGGSAGLFTYGGLGSVCVSKDHSSFTVAALARDKRPDLITTRDCAQDAGGPVGVSQWSVFPSSCQ